MKSTQSTQRNHRGIKGGNTSFNPSRSAALAKPKKTEIRSRHWCLTINNWTEEELTQFKSVFEKYIVGEEICPTTGTPHLQGWGSWKHDRSFSTMKKLFPRANFRPAKGSEFQNWKYCAKEGTIHTNIEKPRSPKESEEFVQENIRLAYIQASECDYAFD